MQSPFALANTNVIWTNLSWSMLFMLCTLVATWFYIAQFLRPWLKSIRLAFSLPGPPALPLIGNALLAADRNVVNTIGVYGRKIYGPIFRIWISILPAIVITDPQHIQALLISPKHTGKIYVYRFLHNFLGEGLITSTGTKWKMHRKLIQPIFTNNILDTFVDTFADSAQCLLSRISAQNGKVTNITSLLNNCVMDILNEAVLGVPINNNGSVDMEQSPFRQGKMVAQYRISRPWLLFNWIYDLTDVAANELEQKNNLNNFTKRMIDKHRSQQEKGELWSGRKSLLHRFLEISEQNPTFTEDDVIQEICTFMLAGQESVASALVFCLHLLAKHKDHQKRCVEELENIFKDSDRPPDRQDLNEMHHLDRCIKETLRLYPSVPLIARKAAQDIMLNEECTIPEGCSVFISPFVTHRIPEIYPNPEEFDPSRFEPEEVAKRHAYAYIPFSAGPRNCIGYKFSLLELKTVMSTILRHFEICLPPEHENVTLAWRITIRATGGVWLRFKPRTIDCT